jgi:DNA invertase Pin-like site-specific DNA recombinase
MGWEVVRVFKDKGRSGYTREHRPEFEEMIEFLGGGQADVLITRHHDRLTRNPNDFARLMQVCLAAKPLTSERAAYDWLDIPRPEAVKLQG